MVCVLVYRYHPNFRRIHLLGMPEFSSQNYTQSPSPTSDNLQLGLKKFFH